LLAAPFAAPRRGGGFAIEDLHLHGDVDGQQLDQGAVGIVLVMQSELPGLVVDTMFSRLSQGQPSGM